MYCRKAFFFLYKRQICSPLSFLHSGDNHFPSSWIPQCMYGDLMCVTFDWDRDGTTHQPRATVGVTPAVRAGVGRQGLMNRLIASLPCQDPTCYRFECKKLHPCPFFRHPASSQQRLGAARPTCRLRHRWLSACFLLDGGIGFGILSQHSGHV